MPPRKKAPRGRGKELRTRPTRRKVSPLVSENIEYVDYKDVELLKAFISERAKIRAQRVSGNNRQQQREVARAIKTAREMALIEYARRPMTQRRSDRRRGRPGDERSGDERAADLAGDGPVPDGAVSDELAMANGMAAEAAGEAVGSETAEAVGAGAGS